MPSAIRTPLARLLLLAIIGYLAVIACGLWIVAHPEWSSWEQRIVQSVHSAQFFGLDAIALTINALFGSGGAILVMLIVMSWALLVTRSWQPTVRIGAVILMPWALTELIKVIVQRPRPDPISLAPLSVSSPMTFSYPSGHTAFAAAVCCAIVLALPAGRARQAAMVAAVLIVTITGWSRVYLGVHYPTDVVAAMVLVPLLSIALDRTLRRFRPHDRDSDAAAQADSSVVG